MFFPSCMFRKLSSFPRCWTGPGTLHLPCTISSCSSNPHNVDAPLRFKSSVTPSGRTWKLHKPSPPTLPMGLEYITTGPSEQFVNFGTISGTTRMNTVVGDVHSAHLAHYHLELHDTTWTGLRPHLYPTKRFMRFLINCLFRELCPSL